MEINIGGSEQRTKLPRRMSVSGISTYKRSPTKIEQDTFIASSPSHATGNNEDGLSTKMRMEELYLVASKMGQELQTLREFSDFEKELWQQERTSNEDKENLKMATFELEQARSSIVEMTEEKNTLKVQIQLLESALKVSMGQQQSAADENLKVSLFSSKLEAKQALENLKVLKKNHLENLIEKSSKKNVNMVKHASREIYMLDRS